jgi:hypothetical protein
MTGANVAVDGGVSASNLDGDIGRCLKQSHEGHWPSLTGIARWVSIR